MSNLLIPAEGYGRIFDTIHSILLFEDDEVNHSCLYFSILGCVILKEHYKIDSRVAVGLASYMVDEDDYNVLVFAERGEKGFISTENGFHSWIETNDWVIDFTSPLFPEMCQSKGMNATIEPRMFQKLRKNMAGSGIDLAKNGDFFVAENYELTNQMVDTFISLQINLDLVEISRRWYRKPPEKMYPSIPIGDQNGKFKNLETRSSQILGSW